MSDSHHVDAAATAAIIGSDAEFFSKSGPVPSRWDDARRFPRFAYRARVKGTVYPNSGSKNKHPVECLLLTRDVSRGGMNLLHTEQLFPQQRIDVVLKDGSVRPVEVVWCRRLAHRCYSLGCRFIKPDFDCPEMSADAASPDDPLSRIS
jgi:hypothetical protein